MSNGISRSGIAAVAIDRESDADAAEQQLRLAAAAVEHIGRQVLQPSVQAGIDRSERAVRALHLVKCYCHLRPGDPSGRESSPPRYC